MLIISIAILFFFTTFNLSNAVDLLPWETYLQLGNVEKPLGLIVNESSIAHRHFLIGYLCFHSFMYDTAQEAFQLAIDSDPTLVEAHIGRLLGHKQALWAYTNRSGALEVLNDTWSLFNEYNVSLTPIQSAYMKVAPLWFLPENTAEGEEAFLNAMLNLTKEFPSNNDAQTLLGLAYINKALRESAQLNILESPALFSARTVLQTVFTKEPNHPGCLHYLIHAFDVPRVETALQGVPYAYKYGQMVVTASHAQHMPTHTWIHIGAWLLAQAADIKSVEVSLSLCLRKQLLPNDPLLSAIDISPLTISQLVALLNSTQSQNLVYCDRDNRAHSQEWLVYSYIQTGRYRKSVNTLKDMVRSNQIYPIDKYYVPYIYGAQSYIITDVFFWTMYGNKINKTIIIQAIDEVLAHMNSTSIEIFNNNVIDSSFLPRREFSARFVECIRLLLMNPNDANTNASIEYHLARILNISTIIKPQMNSTATRMLIMISQINALRWCLNGAMNNCLTELDKATQMELSMRNDYNRPDLVPFRASELFAFYLLITHRYYSSSTSSYTLNNSIVAISDFPAYAIGLYTQENQTDPHRGINTLGMARAYSQMGQIDRARQFYEKILCDWSESTYSSDIDRLVITEATNYLLEVKTNQTRSDGFSIYSSVLLINIVTMFILFIN